LQRQLIEHYQPFLAFLKFTGYERKIGLLLIDTFERVFNPQTSRPLGSSPGGLLLFVSHIRIFRKKVYLDRSRQGGLPKIRHFKEKCITCHNIRINLIMGYFIKNLKVSSALAVPQETRSSTGRKN